MKTKEDLLNFSAFDFFKQNMHLNTIDMIQKAYDMGCRDGLDVATTIFVQKFKKDTKIVDITSRMEVKENGME